jgi:hypothetical protein
MIDINQIYKLTDNSIKVSLTYLSDDYDIYLNDNLIKKYQKKVRNNISISDFLLSITQYELDEDIDDEIDINELDNISFIKKLNYKVINEIVTLDRNKKTIVFDFSNNKILIEEFIETFGDTQTAITEEVREKTKKSKEQKIKKHKNNFDDDLTKIKKLINQINIDNCSNEENLRFIIDQIIQKMGEVIEKHFSKYRINTQSFFNKFESKINSILLDEDKLLCPYNFYQELISKKINSLLYSYQKEKSELINELINNFKYEDLKSLIQSNINFYNSYLSNIIEKDQIINLTSNFNKFLKLDNILLKKNNFEIIDLILNLTNDIIPECEKNKKNYKLDNLSPINDSKNYLEIKINPYPSNLEELKEFYNNNKILIDLDLEEFIELIKNKSYQLQIENKKKLISDYLEEFKNEINFKLSILQEI